MQTSIPGMYTAGDCTGEIYQISKAVYEGMKAGFSCNKIFKGVNLKWMINKNKLHSVKTVKYNNCHSNECVLKSIIVEACSKPG